MKSVLTIVLVSVFSLASAGESASIAGQPVYQGAAELKGSPESYNLYEILGRLEQMQIEMQNLRGQVEEQTHLIDELKVRQQNLYADFDQRLQNLEGGGQPAKSADDLLQLPPLPEPVPETPKTLPKKASGNEKAAYQQAYETLRSGRTEESVALFEQFLIDFPSGTFADNAQYWLGEAYKVKQDNAMARESFEKLIQNHPSSPKVPDALLKLGYIAFEENDTQKAREVLSRILKDYPGTTAAHLAERKLTQLGGY
ncbi:MAG: tol-pal system protein YbgF [Gammaproteobacteria bacterium]